MIDEALYQLIGERVRNARKKIKMSQAKLASELEMSRTSIVNIEAGRQHAPIHVLWDIAEKLNTDVGLLLPSSSEFIDHSIPVALDRDTVSQIEDAANGDLVTKRQLITFISKTKSKVCI